MWVKKMKGAQRKWAFLESGILVCFTFKVWCYVLAGCFILDWDILKQFLLLKI